jgi:hypothetical protein
MRRLLFLAVVCLAALSLLPLARSAQISQPGPCKCAPKLTVTPLGCTCALQISNVTQHGDDCVRVAQPNGSFACGRSASNPGVCWMSFNATEVGAGAGCGSGQPFSLQSGLSTCGQTFTWSLPCAGSPLGGPTHQLALRCTDCPLLMP